MGCGASKTESIESRNSNQTKKSSPSSAWINSPPQITLEKSVVTSEINTLKARTPITESEKRIAIDELSINDHNILHVIGTGVKFHRSSNSILSEESDLERIVEEVIIEDSIWPKDQKEFSEPIEEETTPAQVKKDSWVSKTRSLKKPAKSKRFDSQSKVTEFPPLISRPLVAAQFDDSVIDGTEFDSEVDNVLRELDTSLNGRRKHSQIETFESFAPGLIIDE
ncbi:hypothetical protein HK096_010234, partial [Nowakowskiella sp. JEL0078]